MQNNERFLKLCFCILIVLLYSHLLKITSVVCQNLGIEKKFQIWSFKIWTANSFESWKRILLVNTFSCQICDQVKFEAKLSMVTCSMKSTYYSGLNATKYWRKLDYKSMQWKCKYGMEWTYREKALLRLKLERVYSSNK